MTSDTWMGQLSSAIGQSPNPRLALQVSEVTVPISNRIVNILN
jgi:hypothetical protein